MREPPEQPMKFQAEILSDIDTFPLWISDTFNSPKDHLTPHEFHAEIFSIFSFQLSHWRSPEAPDNAAEYFRRQ